MNNMKELFLNGGGDAYFERNRNSILDSQYNGSPAFNYLGEFIGNSNIITGGQNELS